MQSGLFVKYLIDYDSTDFKNLLRDLEEKKNYRKSFLKRYEKLPADIFELFITSHTGQY
jgi:hypothetical protein